MMMILPNDLVGWILRGTREPLALKSIASHQLLTVVHDYGCRFGGALELYVPEKADVVDDGVHDMVEVLRATGVVADEPYIVNTDRVHDKVRTMKPRLFQGDPPFFRIYRIREDRLRSLIETLDRR